MFAVLRANNLFCVACKKTPFVPPLQPMVPVKGTNGEISQN